MTRSKIAASALAAAVLLAAVSFSRLLEVQPESTIWVSGGSTVRSYKCTATKFNAIIVTDSPENAAVPLADLVSNGEVGLPIAQLDCGNGTMNDHMRKALKAKESPNIVFRLTSYKVNDSELLVKGNLSMAGVERPVELLGRVMESNGIVKATARTQVKMSDWGVKPPTLMMGTMKVHDAATIGFEIGLKK